MGEDRWPVGVPTSIRPVRVIGRGSTGTVWSARDGASGRDVAVKVLDAVAPPGVVDPGHRLELEGRALSRLHGVDGIVRIHQVGTAPDGTGWMVVDLASGGSLADRGPRTWSSHEVATIGRRLADTLARVHAHDVAHGDLTPSNILFDGDGGPLVADFGMADLGGPERGPGGLTPAFAAPERLRGTAASPAADVYSLGATLRWAWDPECGPAARDGEASVALGAVLGAACDELAARRPAAGELGARLGSLVDR